MNEYCKHFSCRLDTASEMLWLSRILNRPDIKLLIPRVLFELKEVRCRHVPRKGSPQAPLLGDNP